MTSIGQTTEKILIPQTELVRSGPIYMETPGGTVTVVKEGYAPSGMAGEVATIAAYIIDDKGVRRISLVRSGGKRRLLAVAFLLFLGVVFWLFRPQH